MQHTVTKQVVCLCGQWFNTVQNRAKEQETPTEHIPLSQHKHNNEMQVHVFGIRVCSYNMDKQTVQL